MQSRLFSTVTAIVLCMCSVQTCLSVNDETMREYLNYHELSDLSEYLNGSEAIKDIGPEFVEDVRIILEKFHNNPYVIRYMTEFLSALSYLFHGSEAKITSAVVKAELEKEEMLSEDYNNCWIIETINVSRSLLLKELPQERIGGVINLIAALFGEATEQELENALGYLYGTVARPVDFYPKLLMASSLECSKDDTFLKFYEEEFSDLAPSNESQKLNRKVFKDMSIIVDKFQHIEEVSYLIEFLKDLLVDLDDNTRVDICESKNEDSWFDMGDEAEQDVIFTAIDLEIILAERVPEENFKDLLNLMRASYKIEGSDWQKAVEYVYNPDYFNVGWCENLTTIEMYKEYYEVPELNSYFTGSEAIKDIGHEFVEDVQVIVDKFDNNLYVIAIVVGLLDGLADELDGRSSKITSATFKEKMSNDIEFCSIDDINVLQTILLRQLPPERVSGVINLLYVLSGIGSEQDLENALRYVYGTEPRSITAVNLNIQSPASQNCTAEMTNSNQESIYELKSMNSTKLNPKVLGDILVIAEKFPHDLGITYLLAFMDELLDELNDKNSTNDICELKNQSRWTDYEESVPSTTLNIIMLEIIFPERVPEENFKDLLNLMRASYKIDGSDWQKAMNYVYRPDYFNVKLCDRKDINTNMILNS